MSPHQAGPDLPALPRPGAFRPGVVSVRLVGPPAVIDAALTLLADMMGDAWQPGTRKPGRHAGGDQLQYGTLIVPAGGQT